MTELDIIVKTSFVVSCGGDIWVACALVFFFSWIHVLSDLVPEELGTGLLTFTSMVGISSSSTLRKT